MKCKNCHTIYDDSHNFCQNCGARNIRNRLTLKLLLLQINEEFLSIDNKFLRTLIDMLRDPKQVIDGYINGLRKKYIGVIPFYAISLTVLGFQMFILTKFYPEFLEGQNQLFNDSFALGSGGAKNPFGNFEDIFNEYQGVLYTILMPFIAAGTLILFLDKRKYNFTEHLVINVYINAELVFFNCLVYLIMAIVGYSDYMTATIILSPIMLGYGGFAFKKLYQISFISALIRYVVAYLLYMMIFMVILSIIIFIFLIVLYASGNFRTN